MLSCLVDCLRLVVRVRPLVSIPVSGDRHSVSYSPLGSAPRGGHWLRCGIILHYGRQEARMEEARSVAELSRTLDQARRLRRLRRRGPESR